MSDPALRASTHRRNAPLVRAGDAGARVRIDPDAVTGRLVRAAAAPGAASLDGYFAACALAQWWADAALLARRTGQSAQVRADTAAWAGRSAEAADRAAAVIAAGGRPDPAAEPGPAINFVDVGVPALSLLEGLMVAATPECCGYDLADVRRCLADAAGFAAAIDPASRIAVAGIRSGGSVLAPLWAAGLAASLGRAVPWVTVRPIGAPPRRLGYDGYEIAGVPSGITHLVLVDDLPNSGDTAMQLAECVAGHADRLWLASVGQVAPLSADGTGAPGPAATPIHAESAGSSRTGGVPRRLWEALMPADEPAFLARLAGALPSGRVPADARVAIRCPTLEARYGRAGAWRPWNDPALGGERRRLVNPRKTPLIVTDPAGTPLYHLRFIGEGPYGRAEHDRAREIDAGVESWFLDGYRIAAHVPGLRPLATALAQRGEERAVLLRQCGDRLREIAAESLAAAMGADVRRDPDERCRVALAALARRTGSALPPPPSFRTAAGISATWGRSRRPIRSSLRYSLGAWHWQVDPAGTVHRFQLEAGWGSVSWPELEAASLALEHDLVADDAALVAVRAGLDGRALADALPWAAVLAVEALAREVRVIDAAGRMRLHDDLVRRWTALDRLATISKEADCG